MSVASVCNLLFMLLILTSSAQAQQSGLGSESSASGQKSVSSYLLGPKDTISVWANEVSEISASFEVNSDGNINMPMLGRTHVDGLTTEQVEAILIERLKKYIIQPQVVVNVTGFRKVTASILGAVVSPGVRDLKAQQTLLGIISEAGGLRPEASPVVRVTRKADRGPLPVRDAVLDATGMFRIGDVNLKTVESNPGDNIEIVEDDLITVSVLPVVYITGDVAKPGGIATDNSGGVSVLKALSQAGGLTAKADPAHARILRPILDGRKQAELPIDLKNILQGKASDVQLLPSDVLFIPGSVSKQAALKALSTGVTVGTSLLSWGLIGVLRR